MSKKNKKSKKENKVGKMIPIFEAKKNYYHKNPETDLEKFVMSLVPEIMLAYGLGEIGYYVQTLRDEDPNHFETEKGSMLMSINYVKEYKTAYLNITPALQRMFDHGEKKMIARALVHEIGHIVMNELAMIALDRFVTEDSVKNCVEETTESIAQIVRRLLETTNPKVYKY